MKGSFSQTIIAPATAPAATGAVAIIRLSGDDALMLAREVFFSTVFDKEEVVPRKMYLGTVTTKNFKDKAFCVYYKAPVSYTGEDVVEFHTHGGKAIVSGLMRELTERGARPAEAGEFTKRAFLNGKLSLAEAEGVADIINAESEAGVMQAYRMLTGETYAEIKAAAELLLNASAAIDVALDYPEEVGEDTKAPVFGYLNEVKEKLTALLKSSADRRYINNGITVALAGLTNVGKSSLMNALLKDDRAIVTEIPGTTRDTLREQLEINGIRLNLVDTAGIRESDDAVEKIGIDRARAATESADLVLFVRDLSEKESEEERALLKSINNKNVVIVGNKCDKTKFERKVDVYTSVVTGEGIEKLIDAIFKKVHIGAESGGAVLTRERQVFSVKEALAAVENALKTYSFVTPDCLMEDVRTAYRALTSVTGENAEESVVDKIFSEFCVGK